MILTQTCLHVPIRLVTLLFRCNEVSSVWNSPLSVDLISGILRVYCGYTAGILWVYCGYTAGIMRVYSGYTAGILRIYCEYAEGVLRVYCGYTACILRVYCGYTAGMLRVYYEYTVITNEDWSNVSYLLSDPVYKRWIIPLSDENCSVLTFGSCLRNSSPRYRVIFSDGGDKDLVNVT